MHNYEKLLVWQRGMELTRAIYALSQHFSSDERFGLTSQIRRAAVSIPSNIAEGCGRNSDKELCQFLAVALGSVNELHTQLILAQDLLGIEEKLFQEVSTSADEVRKMLQQLLLNKRNH